MKELSKELLEALLTCTEGLFVIDESTKILLYVNDFFSDEIKKAVGQKKCYEVLAKRRERCTICPRHTDLELQEGGLYVWDYYDPESRHWYKIKNRLAVIDGVRYRMGNVNRIGDMMELGHDAIKEMAEMKRLLEERKQMQHLLEYEWSHDRLTGLYNRNQYVRDLAEYYAEVECAGVLFFDLNNLKEVNDLYHHKAGDELLRRLADIIFCPEKEQIRCYRIGGDEFILIYAECTKKELEGIRKEIEGKLEANTRGDGIPCSVAIGSVWSPTKGDMENLVAEADRRMYENKLEMKKNRRSPFMD